MKKLILFMFALVALAACGPNPKSLTARELAEYQSGYGQYITNMEPDTNYIAFYFDGIIDLIYNPSEDAYVIEYDDPDVFDYEYLYELSADSIVKNYVELETTKENFRQILSDLDKSVVERAYMENDQKWVIKEITIPSDCCLHYRYSLEKDTYYQQ